jgi:hypothetical protein
MPGGWGEIKEKIYAPRMVASRDVVIKNGEPVQVGICD